MQTLYNWIVMSSLDLGGVGASRILRYSSDAPISKFQIRYDIDTISIF